MDGFGGSSDWKIFLKRQDFNSARELYRHVVHPNSLIIKDVFIEGCLNIEYKKLADAYERNARLHGCGTEYLLVDKPESIWVSSLQGYVLVLSDKLKLPMTKNIRQDALDKMAVSWRGQPEQMRHIQNGLPDSQIHEIGQEFFAKLRQYCGVNFPTFLFLFGFGRSQQMKPLMKKYKLGAACLYGCGSTGTFQRFFLFKNSQFFS